MTEDLDGGDRERFRGEEEAIALCDPWDPPLPTPRSRPPRKLRWPHPVKRRRQAAAKLSEADRRWVLVATIIASAIAFIDHSVVMIALPSLQSDFGASVAASQWIVHAYALFMGALILVGGALGDRVGRRRVFIWGVGLFGVASALCAMATSIEMMIASRALQGIGAALLIPQSLAILSAAYPKESRGRAIGVWAGASAISTALGPPLGGALIDALDWRAAFWINLPLIAVVLWLCLRFVPESRNASARGAIDWAGAAAALAAFGLITFGLTALSEPALGGLVWPLLIAGCAAFAGFLWIESRAQAPLLPLELFRSRAFAGANAMTLFLYGALGGVLFLAPFDLIERRGLSAAEAGLIFAPLMIIIGAMSRYTGAWADKHGPRRPLTIGSALVCAGIGGLAIGAADLTLGVIGPLLLLGVGMGCVAAPLSTVVMNAAPDAQAGAASGVNNAASRLAGLVAIAACAAVATSAYGAALSSAALDATQRFGALPAAEDPSRPAQEAAFTHAYASAMMMAALWAGVATVIAAVTLRPTHKEKTVGWFSA